MGKKVSIITPCLNGELFVARYLDSILDQTYRNIELIFINDGSTDRTEKIVKSYLTKFEDAGMELKYIYKENSGQAAALNEGLKIFTGEYLTWPDSDDILTKDSIKKKVDFLERNTEYGLVRTDAKLVNENNINLIKGYFAKNNPNKYKEELFLDFIMENNVWFAPGCYMVRVGSFLDVNPSKKIYDGVGGQNWQMFLPITYKYKCGFIEEPLYIYVVRENSHSHNISSLDLQLKRCAEHEDILINTIYAISMLDEERKKYLDIIKEKYFRKRFIISSDFNNKKLSKKFYNELKNNYSITKLELIQYLSTKNIIFNLVIRGTRKVMRCLI